MAIRAPSSPGSSRVSSWRPLSSQDALARPAARARLGGDEYGVLDPVSDERQGAVQPAGDEQRGGVLAVGDEPIFLVDGLDEAGLLANVQSLVGCALERERAARLGRGVDVKRIDPCVADRPTRGRVQLLGAAEHPARGDVKAPGVLLLGERGEDAWVAAQDVWAELAQGASELADRCRHVEAQVPVDARAAGCGRPVGHVKRPTRGHRGDPPARWEARSEAVGLRDSQQTGRGQRATRSGRTGGRRSFPWCLRSRGLDTRRTTAGPRRSYWRRGARPLALVSRRSVVISSKDPTRSSLFITGSSESTPAARRSCPCSLCAWNGQRAAASRSSADTCAAWRASICARASRSAASSERARRTTSIVSLGFI